MRLAALGMFVFDLASLPFDELQRRTGWKHATNPRVGARDAAQFVGPGPETISLFGSAVDELQDGAASLRDLRDMADSGDAWPLLDGEGNVFGNFVITDIDERRKFLRADGRPRRIDFGIDLLRVDGAPA